MGTDSRVMAVAGGVLTLVVIGVLALQSGLVPTPWADQHGEATVTITGEDGETKAVVEAEVADTPRERYVGLSEHDSLADGRGMLFVYDEPDDHTYVMRNMSFGIEIVYVDADGTITKIHSARAPGPDENGEAMRYPGYGQYVLEVPKGYMEDNGISEGDQVEIEFRE
jgi:uncharacterized membrane protein (UPF0127 family)